MLKRTLWSVVAVLAVCFLLPSVALGGEDAATFDITATVDAFAEWDDDSPTIAAGDWDGHITAVDQTRTVTEAMTLYANVTTTLTPTVGTNDGVLTNGTETLTTSYQIQGDVTVPDDGYMATGTGAGQFFEATNTYTVTHVAGDGSYAISFMAQAVSPADRAPDSGDYTCGVVLTASW